MRETELHSALVFFVLVTAAITFILLFRLAVPYRRHSEPGWGPMISEGFGWLIMESPAVLIFVATYVQGENSAAFGSWGIRFGPTSICTVQRRPGCPADVRGD